MEYYWNRSFRTTKMLILVLCQTVDNWLLSAAVQCACRSQLLLPSNVLCVSILEWEVKALGKATH